jgi:hypothetical protein
MSNGLPLTSTRALDDWRTETENFRKAEETERLHRRRVEQRGAPDWETWFRVLDDRICAVIDRWLELNPLQDALDAALSDERSDRREETKAAIAEAKHLLETRFAALEQRLDWETGDRWDDRITAAQTRLRADLVEAVSKAVATQIRVELVQELVQARETQRALETKLTDLEERLERYQARSGKLPLVGSWQPETVTYANDLVSYGGALWQATRDTAHKPGGSDWVCVARAGRDAVSFTLRGAFNATARYRKHDIIELDGSSYVACRDDPGLPGHGIDWQLLAGRGRPGIQGIAGPRGHRGDRGPKAEPPPTIVTWKIDRERYRAIPVLSNSEFGAPLELRELFEMYHAEASYG